MTIDIAFTPPATATADALALAETLLVGAPKGAVTLINGNALERVGGWSGVAAGLNAALAAQDVDLFECLPGDGLMKVGCTCDTLVQPKHDLSRDLDCEFVTTVIDSDTSTDLGWDRESGEDFGSLPSRLSPFGAPSLPSLVGAVVREDELDGTRPVMFVQVAGTRPYAEMLCRQRCFGRLNAQAAAETYRWLASDLAAVAAARPNAVTLIATDDRDPEWRALVEVAALITPSVPLHAV